MATCSRDLPHFNLVCGCGSEKWLSEPKSPLPFSTATKGQIEVRQLEKAERSEGVELWTEARSGGKGMKARDRV